MRESNVSEHDAAKAFVEAWKNLDCQDFIEMLADDCRYASQYVFEELTSKTEIAEYLTGKMNSIRSSGNTVTASIATIISPDQGRPCVLMRQGESEEIAALVVFEIEGDKIQRYDLCMPELFELE